MNIPVKNRVPHIIFLYWVIKIVSTTLGETGADMFSMTFNFGYWETIVIFLSLFLILLGIKLSLKGYRPVVYWLTFTASARMSTPRSILARASLPNLTSLAAISLQSLTV